MIKVDITGDEKVREAFRTLVPKLQNKALAKLASAIHDDVKERIAPHYVKGALEQSLRLTKIEDGYAVYNDLQRAPHARFVHWGWPKDRQPYEIRPKDKRALCWPVPGGFRFARKVMHPGYKGDPWFQKAADAAPRLFAQIVQQLQKEI